MQSLVFFCIAASSLYHALSSAKQAGARFQQAICEQLSPVYHTNFIYP